MLRSLLAFTFTILISISLVHCGDSGTGPDPGNENEEEPETYTVSVDMTPSDAGTVSPTAEDSYEEDKEIQLLANAGDEYVFTGWTGDMEGDVNPLPLTVSEDFDITANFERKKYDLTTDVEGEGSVQENVLEQKSKDYEHGTAVELVANPAKGYTFVEWTGDVEGSDNPAEITVDDPKEVTAVFEKKDYELSVTTEGSGGISEQVVSKAKDYEYGDVIELEPSAAEGWKFVEWDGDLTGSDNPAQITVDTAKAVTAVFERKTFALDIATQGDGSIAKDPDRSEYKYGDTVTLTGEPDENWSFKEWAGKISGTTPEIDITVHSERDITAVFEEKTYDLTVNTEGEGSVDEEAVQAKSYNHGTSVALTADPAEGWRFVEWDGDLSGSDNSTEITVDDPKEVTAIFEPLFYVAKNGVTIKCPAVEPGEKGNLNGEKYSREVYEAVDRETLEQMIENGEDVTTVCTTQITDMNNLFGADIGTSTISFNQDISGWDVSNVTDMSQMFSKVSDFNQSIGHWDVSNVTDMEDMFHTTDSFNQDLDGWDVSSVTDMNNMFDSAVAFNQDLSDWDVSSVTDIRGMFSGAESFNQDIGEWDVSNVTEMSHLFIGADSFNQDIGGWDVSNVTTMVQMFDNADDFNQDLGGWDVSNVTFMNYMFDNASSFDQDLSGWCVSEIDSEPLDFSAGAGFEGDDDKMPVWDTCPE